MVHWLALLALLSFPVAATALPRHTPSPPHNGWLVVSHETGDGWRQAGRLPFGKHLTTRKVLLPVDRGQVKVRIQHRGPTAAHLDLATLDGALPRVVVGGNSLTLRKIASGDHDLIDIRNRTMILTFDAEKPGLARLQVRARVEPERITKEPFRFPESNLFRRMTPTSEFYSYRLGSQSGRLTVDGELTDEALETPLFKVYSRTGTGHPSGYTYGWVRNDAGNLYVALDFVPDNTMDGPEDYAEVYVRTRSGVKVYRVTAFERRWGRAGFTYTSRAGYQHKAYEFAIPLQELGARRGPVKLAFAAYGTAAPDKGAVIEASPVADQGTTDGGDSGCDCAVSGAGAPQLGLLALLLLGFHLWSRRRF